MTQNDNVKIVRKVQVYKIRKTRKRKIVNETWYLLTTIDDTVVVKNGTLPKVVKTSLLETEPDVTVVMVDNSSVDLTGSDAEIN